MPRALRIQYPGAIYHVMNRGDRREPIFRDDLDHKKFLTTLAEVCKKSELYMPTKAAMMPPNLTLAQVRLPSRHRLSSPLLLFASRSGLGVERDERKQRSATS